jgi:chromosomal replication initiation ATPase DnaA
MSDDNEFYKAGIAEIHCGLCFRMHPEGPCPTDDLLVLSVPTNAEAVDFAELLAHIRPAEFAEESLRAVAVSGSCQTCGSELKARVVDDVGTGMSPVRSKRTESFCQLCEVSTSIPPAFRWSKFDSSEMAKRVKNLAAIAESRKAVTSRRVLLTGEAGSGKTSLVTAMFRVRAERGERNLYMPARRLGVARTQHALGAGEPELVSSALSAKILVLDDVGAERDTTTNAIPDVISERFDNQSPTWITSAMTKAEMAKRYGGGVARRAFDGVVVKCDKAVP